MNSNSNSSSNLRSEGPGKRLPGSRPEAAGAAAGAGGSTGGPGKDGLRASGGVAVGREALRLLLEMWRDARCADQWLLCLEELVWIGPNGVVCVIVWPHEIQPIVELSLCETFPLKGYTSPHMSPACSLALGWLRSLSSWLVEFMSSAYSSPAGSAQSGSKEQRQLSSHVSGMLCALLCHPEPSVQVSRCMHPP